QCCVQQTASLGRHKAGRLPTAARTLTPLFRERRPTQAAPPPLMINRSKRRASDLWTDQAICNGGLGGEPAWLRGSLPLSLPPTPHVVVDLYASHRIERDGLRVVC